MSGQGHDPMEDSSTSSTWDLSRTWTCPADEDVGIRSACVLLNSGSGDTLLLLVGNQAGRMFLFRDEAADQKPSAADIDAMDTDESDPVQATLIPYQHDHAVTALLASDQWVVSGCKDTHLRLFDTASFVAGDPSNVSAPLATLKGHSQPVTSLAWASDGAGATFLVSGSWDGTAKIWNVASQQLVATLPDHENSVCVVGLPSTTNSLLSIATGSAGVAEQGRIVNHSIRLWSVDTGAPDKFKLLSCQANQHEGPIRDVALISASSASPAESYLASCSNDGTVMLRQNAGGAVVSTLTFLPQSQQEQAPMLLSLTSGQTADSLYLVASAEDGHVVVWDGLLENSPSPPQILLHPTTVWKVLALPNGDFGTCGDDGKFHIFTRIEERKASEAQRQAFAEAAQAKQSSSSQAAAAGAAGGGLSADEMAKLPWWVDREKHAGKSGGHVQVFRTSATAAIAAQWNGSEWTEIGQVMGGACGGSKYDHMLPIEVEDARGGGGATANYQLGYNNGENPFSAAQRFLDENQLPQYHLNEVAKYIEQRIPSAASYSSSSGAVASSAPSVAMTGTPLATFEHVPAKTYKTFTLPASSASTTLDKMKNKLQEIGKLNEDQLKLVSSLMETLGSSSTSGSSISNDELEILMVMLETWPPSESFPALDLARLAVLHADAASLARSSFWDRVVRQALQLLQQQATSPSDDKASAVAIPMLSLRLFANAFEGGPGSIQAVSSQMNEILLQALPPLITSSNKNVRLSVATLLHNICLYLHATASSSPLQETQVTAICTMLRDILDNKSYQAEAILRTLTALGTLVVASPAAKAKANGLFLASKVEPAASPHGDTAKTAAKEVYAVLQ